MTGKVKDCSGKWWNGWVDWGLRVRWWRHVGTFWRKWWWTIGDIQKVFRGHSITSTFNGKGHLTITRPSTTLPVAEVEVENIETIGRRRHPLSTTLQLLNNKRNKWDSMTRNSKVLSITCWVMKPVQRKWVKKTMWKCCTQGAGEGAFRTLLVWNTRKAKWKGRAKTCRCSRNNRRQPRWTSYLVK